MIFFLIFLLSFSSCVSYGDTYYTYEIDGIEDVPPSRYEILPDGWQGNHNLGWTNRFNDGIADFFYFQITERGSKNTEPYDLELTFQTGNTDRIMFNQMFFQSKNKEIDLREKITIKFAGERQREQLEGESGMDYRWYEFEKEELAAFRISGIIDLDKYKEEWESINQISIYYYNVDVVFKSDAYFRIKYDITFEGGYGTRNYNFTANFIRKKIANRTTWFTT